MIELDPITIDTGETEEERRAREAALSALEGLQRDLGAMPPASQHAAPPPAESVVPQAPPVSAQSTGRMEAQQRHEAREVQRAAPVARQAGEAFRAGQIPTADPVDLPQGAAPDSPMRVVPPGRLPSPNPELAASVDERFGFTPPASAPPPPQAGGVAPSAPGLGRALDAPQAGPMRQRLRELLAQRQGEAKPPGNAAPDYTGADVSDAIRRPLHAIGSALRAAGGSAPTPFRSEGEAARARDAREVLRETQAAQRKSAARMDERELSLRERAQSALEQDRARREERLAGQAQALQTYRQRQTEIAEAVAEGRLSAEEARREEARARLDLFRAQHDPGSDVSERARARFAEQVDMREQATGTPLDVSAEGMSAEDVEALEQTMRQTRQTRPQRSGGGMSPETRAALDTPPEGWTGTPEQWRALPARQRQQAIRSLGTRAQRGGGEEATGIEIVPGVRSQMDLGGVEVRTLRQGIADARGHAAALGTIDEIARRYGARAVVDPRIESELVAPIQSMMAMVSTLRNTGVINPQEAPTIEAAIPNPRSLRQMTLGEVQARVRSFRTLLEQRISAGLAVRGVDEAGQRRAIAFLQSGRFEGGGDAQRPAPRAADRVIFRYNGRSRAVRAEDAEEARRRLREAGIDFEEEGADAR